MLGVLQLLMAFGRWVCFGCRCCSVLGAGAGDSDGGVLFRLI
jgi:hypothetical protein